MATHFRAGDLVTPAQTVCGGYRLFRADGGAVVGRVVEVFDIWVVVRWDSDTYAKYPERDAVSHSSAITWRTRASEVRWAVPGFACIDEAF